MPTTTGCLTNYCEQAVLDHVFRNTAFAFAERYMGLLVATPTDSGGTEVTTAGSNGYARVALGTGGSCKFNAASSRSAALNADITFGPSTGGPWSTVAYWGLYDASTSGNLLAYGDITDGSIATDDSYRVTSGGTIFLPSTATAKYTDAFANLILDHVTGRTQLTAAETYLGLYEGDPLGAGVETETAGSNGYARQSISGKMGAASGGSITNSVAVFTFGPATANWGTIDYFSFHSASTGGTLYGGAAVGTSKAINNTETAEFATSALTCTLD